MSIRARLAGFIALAVGVAAAIVALSAYRFAHDEALAEVDDFLRARGPVVSILRGFELDEYRGRGGRQEPASEETGPFDEVIREDAIAQFVDAAGSTVTIGGSPVTLPVDERDLSIAARGGPDYLRDTTVAGVHYRILTRPIGPGVAIQVGRDLTATDEILAGLRLRLTLLGLSGAVVAAAAAWLIAGRSLRPVGVLTDAAEHVAATRQLAARIEVNREDELGRLAEAFNGMLAALEDARTSQQRLVADASHELRTPLTSLRTNIELLARGAIDGAERVELVEDLTTEVGELSHLVGELVDLATVGRDEEPRRDMDLEGAVLQAVARARRRPGPEIVVDTEPTPISGRPQNLMRAVSNLLENAAKWGDEGGTVEVTLRDGALSVRDHGPGFDDEDRDRVFERFYRSKSARSKPGSGLGLSIVAAVAQDHGATVFAQDHPGGGAIVGFSLPTS